jgi:hypothetical protein
VRGKASGTKSVMIKTRATKMSKFLVVWRIEPSSSAARRAAESPRIRIVNRVYISSMIAGTNVTMKNVREPHTTTPYSISAN